jgi:SAM-dependent methyltransferase
MEKANYGNWVTKKIIIVTGVVAVFFVGTSFISYYFLIGTIVFIIPCIYFLYAYYKFSPTGGDVQARIRDLVFEYISWNGNGTILDIGCGNGALAIESAKKYPKASVTGIDYWGEMWDYSREVCEKNAEIEGVADRVEFQKANAVLLPFEDGLFDLAISNFVFHEAGGRDKKEVLKEALRVVKPGGHFVFQDLFLVSRFYGKPDELLETVRSWGIQDVRLADTSKLDFIPGALKLSFMVGSIGILYGTK